MKLLNAWVLGVSMLSAELAFSACSVDHKFADPNSGGTSGAGAGTAAKNGGATGKAGGAAAGGDSAAGALATDGGEAGMGGDVQSGMAGTGGNDAVGCGNVVCAAEANCKGTGTAAHCECPMGYSDPRGDGTLCQDIDECANLNGGCDALLTCTNTPGSFNCGACPAGYTGNASTGCVDINECATKNGGCDALVACTNTPGARVCGNCPFGYSGDGVSGCTDINECTSNNGGCDKSVTCVNTPGGHTCGDCPAGYTGGGASGCTDINECMTNNGGCDSHVTCTNTPGSFSCGACPAGYTGTGSTGCVDVNECATSNGGCDGNATCTNTNGSHSCACKSGYAGDGVTCTAPSANCRWNCSGSNCTQVALDSDGDGHGSSACVPMPGDDCDDTQNAIFPGATELCDGIDNDCDKKIDLSDGLPLVGAIQTVSAAQLHVSVASAGDGTFGMVGTSPSAAGIFYGRISASGAASFDASPIFSPSSGDAWLDTHLAWGSAPGNWGVVYEKNGRGGLNANAGMMAFTSCCWQDLSSPGGRGDITNRGQGDLLIAGISVGSLNLVTQGGTSSLTSTLSVSGSWDTYNPRVAANGTSSAVIWQTSSPHALNWSLISANLQFGATETLSSSAAYADISAITPGYGVAWIEGVGFRLAIKKADGTTQCTSSVVPFGTVPSNQQVAVGDSSNGTVVVATSPDSNAIHLYRFDSACKAIDDTNVSSAASAPTEPRVVRGGGHVVVYWTEGTSSGHYRFLSDLLCH